MVDNIAGHIPDFSETVNEMDQFIAEANDIGETVCGIITHLHETWAGFSAEKQREFYEMWHKDLTEMLESILPLRYGVHTAHENAKTVAAVHAKMWPQ